MIPGFHGHNQKQINFKDEAQPKPSQSGAPHNRSRAEAQAPPKGTTIQDSR
jgi:hypothetical protein